MPRSVAQVDAHAFRPPLGRGARVRPPPAAPTIRGSLGPRARPRHVHGLDALAITWSTNRALTGAGTGWASRGALAVSSSTVVHAAFEQYVLGSWGAYYRRSSNSGSTWGTAIRLSRASVGEAGAPSVAAWGSSVDAVWLESDDILAGMDTVVMYRRSTDAGASWSAAVALTPAQESAGMPRIARRGSLVVLTWTNEANGRVYSRASTNGGVAWAPRVLLATTTRKVGSQREGFPVVALGTGVAYVAYYSATKTLRIRRSTNNGASWASPLTLSTSGDGWDPGIAASGSTVIVGYAAATSTDVWTVIRRSKDKGAHWGSVVSLAPKSSYPSFSPVLAVRGTRWMAVLERCTSNSCSSSDAFYRSSRDAGSTWSTTTKASSRHRKYEMPAGVDVATKTLVMYVDYSSTGQDVYVRQGS